MPARKAQPLVHVKRTISPDGSSVYEESEMTVKVIHPASPERGWLLCEYRYIIGIMKIAANTAMTNGFPPSAAYAKPAQIAPMKETKSRVTKS